MSGHRFFTVPASTLRPLEHERDRTSAPSVAPIACSATQLSALLHGQLCLLLMRLAFECFTLVMNILASAQA